MCQPSSCRELNRITELACSGMAPVIVLVVLSKHIGDDAQAPSSTEVGRSIVLLTTQQPILPVVDTVTTSPGQSYHIGNFRAHQLCSSFTAGNEVFGDGVSARS